jgi:hypothetical protein
MIFFHASKNSIFGNGTGVIINIIDIISIVCNL